MAEDTGSLRDMLTSAILRRRLPRGGFEEKPGTGARVEAAAWCTYALSRAGAIPDLLDESRDHLAELQSPDGRVSLSAEHPEAFWPTASALLAWYGSKGHEENSGRAASFLLSTSGQHWPRKAGEPFGHDPALRGWPWIEGTHSWTEPTSMAVIALGFAGHGGHRRVKEAVEMLLDRQIPEGGWNYGNTTVFGRALDPFPAPTGIALQALAGKTGRETVRNSLLYLKNGLTALRTPFSLSWALLGLGAWGYEVPSREAMIGASLALQERYGEHSSSHLSLLLLSLLPSRSLVSAPASKETLSEGLIWES